MTFSVCIFAHNEARLLPNCVGALTQASSGRPFKAHILVNGATDDTASVAAALAAADARLSVHELTAADKANAWNHYVHGVADPDAMNIFIDGDVRPSADAFAALERAFADAPDAYAAATLPATGRSRKTWARRTIEHHQMSGNLYALSALGIQQFRQNNICMPFGAKGEDGLIAYLVLTDLKGGTNDKHYHRLVTAGDSSFEFESLSINSRDLKIYQRRLMRYAERHFQKKILYALLKADGVAAMPDSIYDIYTPEALARLRPRFDPVNFWFDRAVLQQLRAGSLPGFRRS